MLKRILLVTLCFLVLVSPAFAREEIFSKLVLTDTWLIIYRGDNIIYILDEEDRVLDKLNTNLRKTHHMEVGGCGNLVEGRPYKYPNVIAFFPPKATIGKIGGIDPDWSNDVVLKNPYAAWIVQDGKFSPFSTEGLFCYQQYY